MKHTENEAKDDSREKKGWRGILVEWLQIIAAAAVVAFVLNTYIIVNSDVPSGSMENTIMTGSRIIGSRLNYYFTDPERGDIVIFDYGWRCPECREPVQGEPYGACPFCGAWVSKKEETAYFVKRVIGLPGDRIDIADGKVYINDSDIPLDEPYLAETMEPWETFHFEVPEDSYFMMGDNRNHSADAREWENHYILRDKIRAKVLFEYFPKIKALH